MRRSLKPDTPSGLPHAFDRSSAPISNLQSPISVLGSLWGIFAGLAASLCCLGPSAAVLLGLGSASALAGIELDRSLALAGGAALLLGGAALALRPGRACDLRPATRWRRLGLMLAAFALAYGLLGVLLPEWAASRVEATEPPAAAPIAVPSSAAAAPRRATLIIEKMICPPCAAHVHSLLGRKPFVQAFVAEENNEQVVIDYDSRQIDAQALVRLFPQRYRVTLISDTPLP
jgi:hypothetical protein